MAAWSRKMLKIFAKFLCLFSGKNDLRENFQNSVPKGFTVSPIDVLCSNFGKSVKSCAIYLTKKQQNFAWLSRCRCCADRAQNLPGPALVNVLKVLQIWYSHQFTVPEVIRECVNTVKTGCKVFPIFRWSLASSRIITSHMRSPMHVYKDVVVATCYISEVCEVERFRTAKWLSKSANVIVVGDNTTYNFLTVFHCNYVSWYRFRFHDNISYFQKN